MTLVVYYVTVVISAVIFSVGLVKSLQIPFKKLAIHATKQLDLLLDHSVPEDQKDKWLIKNLLLILIWLIIGIALLGVILFVSALPTYVFTRHQVLEADTTTFYFYFSMFIGSSVLFFFRAKGDYSYWSKLLHTLVLDHYALGRFLMSREIKNQIHSRSSIEKKFIIVTGLARSGTTALTNLIYDDRKFHSIKYANMPFLLAPNLWGKVYKRSKNSVKERIHGDQVLVGPNSVEAFEEYFFKVHLNDGYVHERFLSSHEVSEDVLSTYYQYQDLFQKEKDTLYLAKNNNFLLRASSLLKQNQSARVLLIFRDPESHAESLLRQHQNFVEKQKEDEFVLDYMNWLGHHEFGLGHKPFDFPVAKSEHSDNHDTSKISYWIVLWMNYYSYVLDLIQSHSQIVLVHYQDLLEKPSELKQALSSKIRVELSDNNLLPFSPRTKKSVKIPQSELDAALGIYDSLMKQKLQLEDSKS